MILMSAFDVGAQPDGETVAPDAAEGAPREVSADTLEETVPASNAPPATDSPPVVIFGEKKDPPGAQPGPVTPPQPEYLGIELPADYVAPPANAPKAAVVSVPVSQAAPPAETYRQPQVTAPPEKEPDPFPWFTVVPEIGYVFFPKSRMEVNGFKASVEARNGLSIKLHFDLGGAGLAFEMAPLFAIESGGISADGGGFADLSGLDLSAGGSFKAVGGQTAVLYRFSVKKKFFPHLGVGFHGAYLMGKQIDYGAEFYGRIPVGFTAYFAKNAAFVFDMGFMFGVTGIRTPLKLPAMLDTMPEDLRAGLSDADTQADFSNWYTANQAEVDAWIADPNSGLPEGYSASSLAADIANDQLGESLRFGQGFGFDLSIGIRFP